MKKIIALIFIFYGCNSKEEKRTTENKNLPVVEITLKAVGNTMSEMRFEPTQINVSANQKVKLTLINESSDASMPHNFCLIENGMAEKVGKAAIDAGTENNFIPDLPQVLAHTKLLQPKEKTTIEFETPPVGEYDYICTYPGHYTMMKGKLNVQN